MWKARDTTLGVERAIKLIRPLANESARRRARAEARTMARIEHPNILRIFDVGREGDTDFVVMELMSGGSLQDRLDTTGPLSPAEATAVCIDVLRALQAAHAAGVVHRDVKPANILLGTHKSGIDARLGDFGIARLPMADAGRETRDGATLGSLGFMPPEQRLDARSVGPEADVYAVGATLYSLLTAANPVDLFLAGPDSSRWTDVPPHLQAILMRAVALEPEDRYPSASAFEDALVDMLATVGALPAAPARVRHGLRETFQLDPDRGTIVPGTRLGEAPTALPVEDEAAPTLAPARGLRGRWVVAALVLLLVSSVGGWLGLQRLDADGPREATAASAAPTPAATEPAAVDPVPGSSIPATPPLPSPAITASPAAPTTVIPRPTPVSTRAATNRTPVAAPATTRRTSASTSSATGSYGRWKGAFGGRTCELVLDGPPARLVGELIVQAGGRAVSTPLRGAVDSGSVIALADVGTASDAGSYRLDIGSGGAILTGSFTRNDGARVVPLNLERMQ